MSRLEELVNRPQELVDALWPLVDAAVHSQQGRKLVPPLLEELLAALQEQATTSEFANGADGARRMVAVEGYQDAASAGMAVGCSAEWVRKLCRDGLVSFQRVGRRGYLVDVNDLRRHMRGEAA